MSCDFRTRFAAEDGAMTVFGLFLLVATLIFGGLAIDYANALRVRTQMQLAADSAAHAAIVYRTAMGAEAAKAEALDVALAALPKSANGDALKLEDIQFGTWDDASRTFTPDATAIDAAMVSAFRENARNNSVATFLLKFVGLDDWDIRRDSVFETYVPWCLKEGFVAEGIVDVTSGNYYEAGFCIHSNTYVELNTGNILEEGVIVSMPNPADVSGPAGLEEKNPGLGDALTDAYYDLSVADRVDAIANAFNDPSSRHWRPWITDTVEKPLTGKPQISTGDWEEGRIHRASCGGGSGKIMIANDSKLANGVLITDCKVQIGSSVKLENVTIFSLNNAKDAISAAADLEIGATGGCGTGGESQMLTRGGVKLANGVQMYQGQIMAGGDVTFTAQAGSLEGASVIAGGSINGTALSKMGVCGKGAPTNFDPLFFRMAA